MLAAGENEVARDELRWLLDGCPDFIAAHRMLGELALTKRSKCSRYFTVRAYDGAALNFDKGAYLGFRSGGTTV